MTQPADTSAATTAMPVVEYNMVKDTTWPVCRDATWMLRHGRPNRAHLRQVASVVAAYKGMCDPAISQAAAFAKLRQARIAHKAAAHRTVTDRIGEH